MLKPFLTSAYWLNEAAARRSDLAEMETRCRAMSAPRGWRPAQHAAVATAPCFLMEVRNAGMSLLIPVEGDGMGRRDRELEREKGQDSYLIHHPSCRVCLLTPAQIYTQAILFDCLYGLLFAVSQRQWGDQRTHRKKLVHVSSHLWCV